MNKAHLRTALEAVTNTAVLMALIIAGTVFTWNYIPHRSVTKLQSGLQKGKPLARLPGYDYATSSRTLIIAMKPACDRCNESIRLYNQFKDIQNLNDKSTTLLAVFPEPREEVEHYTRQNQLMVDAMPGVSLTAINVRTTPTIVLVDNSGKILNFWVGKLSLEDEQEVINILKSPVHAGINTLLH